MKKFLRPVLGLAVMAFGGLSAMYASAVTTPPAVVPIVNGMNKVALDGVNMIVLRAYRENFNAHSFDVVTFYAESRVDNKQHLDVVPIFNKRGNDTELHEITTGGGADCNLADFRLVKGSGKQPARLIVANRDFGESYADDATVHFVVYELKRNPDGDEGAPPVSFQEARRIDSKKKHCDVNDAFDKELHMGTAGGGRS